MTATPPTQRRARARLWALVSVATALVVLGVILLFTLNQPPGEQPNGSGGQPTAAPTPPPFAIVECPPPTVKVATTAELSNALSNAAPGAVISLADGVYTGNFTAQIDGTADAPITMCGTTESILDGGTTDDGYVLHLDGASYWTLQGFTVQNGQKGVMVDETSHAILRGLTVKNTGDEAIHLRKFSMDNLVIGNTISDTGQRKPKFGEGIYVGTAESNWCDVSNCEPDMSDRNTVSENTISGTTSESVDIKEGTSDGVLSNNSFDGSSIEAADSWVDVKGNNWIIDGNTGENSPLDGFQTHEIIDGWGTGNVFSNNTAAVRGPGFGYSLTPVRDNIVECSNKASQAAEGLSNEECAPS